MAHIGFDSEEITALEKKYVKYFLDQGLSVREVVAKLECPYRFVEYVKTSPTKFEAVKPPDGYRSQIQAHQKDGDFEAAAIAKWWLKHGKTPEEVATIVEKKPSWIYSLIAGKIHEHVKAHDPKDLRKVTVFRTVINPIPKPKGPTQATKDAKKKMLEEACYVLGLFRVYTTKEIALITGFSLPKVHSIVNGMVCKTAEPKDMPHGYWDTSVVQKPWDLVKMAA